MFKTLYVNIYLKLHYNISSWGSSNFIWESVSIESSLLFLHILLTHSLLYSSSRWRAETTKEPQFYWLWMKRGRPHSSMYPPEWRTLWKPECHVLSIKPRAQCLKQADQTVIWKPLFCHLQKQSWCRLLGMSLPVLLCDGLAKLFCQHHLNCQQLEEKWDGKSVFFCLGLTGILLIPFWEQSRGLNTFTKIIWSRI